MEAYNDKRYSLFSRLIRSSFDDAAKQFDNKSIDVLHIDGYHTYDAVRHDFNTWLPKLTDRGIALFHDIDVRDRVDFGVWRFWDEVKQNYPYFEFFHSHGLGVLAVGEDIPDGIRALVTGPQEQDLIRCYFGNLGDYLAELHGIATQRNNVQELLYAKTEECERLEAAHAKAEVEHRANFSKAMEEVERQLAALQNAADYERDLENHIGDLENQIGDLKNQVVDIRAAYAQTREEMRRQLADATDEVAGLRLRLSRIRYRAVDRIARVVGGIPLLPVVTRSMANTMIRLVRKPS